MNPSEYNRTLYDQNLELHRYMEHAKIQYENQIEKLARERDESTASALEHYKFSKLCNQELEEHKKLIDELQKENARFQKENPRLNGSAHDKNIKVELKDPVFEQMETGTDKCSLGQEIDYEKKVADLEHAVAERDERILEFASSTQKEMEQLKKDHASEIKGLKDKYAEMEKDNEAYRKVCEGLQAVQRNRKRPYDEL